MADQVTSPRPLTPQPMVAEPRYPVNGQKIVLRNYDSAAGTGTIKVRAEKVGSDDTQRVVAVVVGESDAVPEPDPIPPLGGADGFIELNRESPTSAFFSHANVPVLGLTAVPPEVDAKKVCILSYDSNDNFLESRSISFKAIPPTFTVPVRADCCLWLVFAPAMTELPTFHETVEDYFPVPLIVPDDNGLDSITRVKLAAKNDAEDVWSHDNGGHTTDADGRMDTGAVPLNPAYQAEYCDAGIGSNVIAGATLRLNQLVALWEYPAGDQTAANPTQELGIGLTETTLNVATAGHARPVRLHLAFHDGFEWSNNTGEVRVEVTWLTP